MDMNVRIQQIENELHSCSKEMYRRDEILLELLALQDEIVRLTFNEVHGEQAQLRIQMNVMESSIEKQRKVVVQMSQEVSGLDKLEEKQRAEYNYLVNKESEQSIEEFLSFKMSKGSEDRVDFDEM